MPPTTFQVLQLTLQALAAFAIAGGLIFTAVQFRAARQAQHVANFTKLVELQMHLREMRVDMPALAGVYTHDVQGLSSDREIREYFFNLMQLSVFEIVWFSYHHGQLPRDYFESWVKRMRDISSEATFQKMISSPSMKILHDDFERYVREMVRNAATARAAAAGNGEVAGAVAHPAGR